MRLYNTLTREVDEVVPVEAGHVTMYTCGPTVYRYVHLGNLRTFMLADLIRRALEFEGLQVTQIMNITDVGHMIDESSGEAVDKMLLAVEDEGLAPLQIAEKYAAAAFDDARDLGIRPADAYPKATEHIPEMIELTQTLIDKGHAYVVDNGQRVLRRAPLPRLRPSLRQHPGQPPVGPSRPRDRPRKRHPADFALWKSAGEGRVMKWDSPVGRGLPRLAHRVLRDVDEVSRRSLRHPHRRVRPSLPAPRGRDRAVRGGRRTPGRLDLGPRGHLRLSGQKIAKSTGNVVRVPELATMGSTRCAFRWLTFQTRYRSEMDFTWEAMAAADHRVKQLRQRMAGVGAGAMSRRARRRGPSTRGSARPSPTTSTCRARWWS